MIDPETGERKPGWLKNLRLFELSGVDVPANPGARVAIFKRGDPRQDGALGAALLKIFKSYDQHAKPFREIMTEQHIGEHIWKIVDALRGSVESILRDESLAHADKMAQIGVSTGQFLAEIRRRFPSAETELAKLLKDHPATAGLFANDEGNMDEIKKQIADLTKSVGDLATTVSAIATRVAKAELSDDERAYHDAMPEAERGEFMKMDAEARKKRMADKPVEKRKDPAAGDDETIQVGTVAVSKKEVGAGVFAVIKSQQNAIAVQAAKLVKLEEGRSAEAVKAEVEKKWPHVPGTVDEKADTLIATRKLGEEHGKRLEKQWDATEAALKVAMAEVGGGGGGHLLKAGSAEERLNQLAKDHQAKNAGMTFEKAYQAIIHSEDGSKLYSAYLAEQPGQPRAA